MTRWMAILLAPSALLAAPTPIPKAKPLGPLVAAGVPYTINWHGENYEATFHATGLFTATSPAGKPWVGQWKIDGKTLHVDESPESMIDPLAPWPPADWSLRWSISVDVAGVLSSGKITITRKK